MGSLAEPSLAMESLLLSRFKGRQEGFFLHVHPYAVIDRQTGRQADRQTGRQANRQTGRQADKQTSRKADKQTNRQTHVC